MAKADNTFDERRIITMYWRNFLEELCFFQGTGVRLKILFFKTSIKWAGLSNIIGHARNKRGHDVSLAQLFPVYSSKYDVLHRETKQKFKMPLKELQNCGKFWMLLIHASPVINIHAKADWGVFHFTTLLTNIVTLKQVKSNNLRCVYMLSCAISHLSSCFSRETDFWPWIWISK